MNSSSSLRNSRPRTPCIGVCSTGIGDSVCRGCKRFLHEVVNWNGYSAAEQHQVLKRIDLFLGQIISDKLEVLDEAKLFQFLQHQGIAPSIKYSPSAGVFALLKAGAGQMGPWALYGIQLKPGHTHKTPIALRDEIDSELYTLSCAHYQRYFEVAHASD